MKTQKEMFWDSHRAVADATNAKAESMAIDLGIDDALAGIPARYPKNSHYMDAYNRNLKNRE